MRYTVDLAGRSFEVDLTGGRITVDGRPVPAEQHPIPGTPLRRLVLAGRSETFALERGTGGWTVGWAGEVWEAAVVDERTRQLQEVTGPGPGAGSNRVISAPMPGLVIRVEVEQGASVVAGAGLLVLEAMKMENELTSPIAGTVASVHVAAGQPVEKGAALVEVSPPG